MAINPSQFIPDSNTVKKFTLGREGVGGQKPDAKIAFATYGKQTSPTQVGTNEERMNDFIQLPGGKEIPRFAEDVNKPAQDQSFDALSPNEKLSQMSDNLFDVNNVTRDEVLAEMNKPGNEGINPDIAISNIVSRRSAFDTIPGSEEMGTVEDIQTPGTTTNLTTTSPQQDTLDQFTQGVTEQPKSYFEEQATTLINELMTQQPIEAANVMDVYNDFATQYDDVTEQRMAQVRQEFNVKLADARKNNDRNLNTLQAQLIKKGVDPNLSTSYDSIVAGEIGRGNERIQAIEAEMERQLREVELDSHAQLMDMSEAFVAQKLQADIANINAYSQRVGAAIDLMSVFSQREQAELNRESQANQSLERLRFDYYKYDDTRKNTELTRLEESLRNGYVDVFDKNNIGYLLDLENQANLPTGTYLKMAQQGVTDRINSLAEQEIDLQTKQSQQGLTEANINKTYADIEKMLTDMELDEQMNPLLMEQLKAQIDNLKSQTLNNYNKAAGVGGYAKSGGGTGTVGGKELSLNQLKDIADLYGITIPLGSTKDEAAAIIQEANSPASQMYNAIISAAQSGMSYKDVIKQIESDVTLKDKEAAKKIANELYNETPAPPPEPVYGTGEYSSVPIEQSVEELGVRSGLMSTGDDWNKLKERGYSDDDIQKQLHPIVDAYTSTIDNIANYLFGE